MKAQAHVVHVDGGRGGLGVRRGHAVALGLGQIDDGLLRLNIPAVCHELADVERRHRAHRLAGPGGGGGIGAGGGGGGEQRRERGSDHGR